MNEAIFNVNGIEVGHAQDLDAITGCTVVMAREGAVVGIDQRGLAPGTRETDLCRPGTLVEKAHAILLTGGSAFGLDAAGGVMRYLHERGIGFETGSVVVPIVPGAVIFDLGIGRPVAPDADMGYRACEVASAGPVGQGCVGAGTGATVGKVLGLRQATKSGVGTAALRAGGTVIGAIVVVNAFGDVVLPGTDQIAAGARDPQSDEYAGTEDLILRGRLPPPGIPNTVIGVVATDASLNSEQITHLARMGNVGLARTIRPIHSLVDGDTIFSLATGRSPHPSDLFALHVAAARVMEQAVISALRHATPLGGLPAGRFD